MEARDQGSALKRAIRVVVIFLAGELLHFVKVRVALPTPLPLFLDEMFEGVEVLILEQGLALLLREDRVPGRITRGPPTPSDSSS